MLHAFDLFQRKRRTTPTYQFQLLIKVIRSKGTKSLHHLQSIRLFHMFHLIVSPTNNSSSSNYFYPHLLTLFPPNLISNHHSNNYNSLLPLIICNLARRVLLIILLHLSNTRISPNNIVKQSTGQSHR